MTMRWGRLVLIDNDGRFVDELSRRIAPVVEELATTSCATGPFEIPPKRDADVVVLSTGLLGSGAIDLVRQIRAVDHSVVLIARVKVPNAVDAILLFDAGVNDCVGAGEDLTFVEARLRRALQRTRACERRTSASGVLELDQTTETAAAAFPLPDDVRLVEAPSNPPIVLRWMEQLHGARSLSSLQLEVENTTDTDVHWSNMRTAAEAVFGVNRARAVAWRNQGDLYDVNH